MKKKRIYLLFLLLLTLVTACKKDTKPADFDYGHLENGNYLNTYFGFTLSLPRGWMVQSQQQMDKMTKEGAEFASGDNKELKAQMKASEVNSANLLSVFKYSQGSVAKFNPSLMLVAENLRNFPAIKDGEHYLFQVRNMLQQTKLHYQSIDSVYGHENLGGRDFSRMNSVMLYQDLQIHQSYFSLLSKSFSLSAVISYTADSDRVALEKVLHSIKWVQQ